MERAKIIEALIKAGGNVDGGSLQELRDTKPDLYSRMDDEGTDIFDLVVEWSMEAKAKKEREHLIQGLSADWLARPADSAPPCLDERPVAKRRMM